MIWDAVHAGFGYFQREAGYTRTGSHGTRVHGRETGQWREADLAVAHWLQHTSRDGDMQLHVHSQIAHVARTATDGKWRAPDSLGYNEHIGAVAAIVSQHLEEALTARFGLEWTARDDGHGFEIKGISGETMHVFSSRRESITADLRVRAARFEQRYGRAASQRELAHLAQASNFTTRNEFLGHLPGWRGARGPVWIGPGTLLVIDEASMLSGPDLADLIAYAKARGAKIILAGDLSQLQAVENGGGMSLLAQTLGYARLAEPVRFHHAWEQAASLRLRDGDASVLAEYDQHGRVIGGEAEEMMDAAAAAYVALAAGGTDTLLMAADHALRRELNRRIREDLITLGIVAGGPTVTIADGTRASAGDLIICTRNDHATVAGEPGRTLANGDLLRIEAITRNELIVRRALDADPGTGQRRWTDRHFVFNSYKDAELGYAVTDHAAQGRTVHRPGRDRRH
jgi:AAA domain/TrwC relaxase